MLLRLILTHSLWCLDAFSISHIHEESLSLTRLRPRKSFAVFLSLISGTIYNARRITRFRQFLITSRVYHIRSHIHQFVSRGSLVKHESNDTQPNHFSNRNYGVDSGFISGIAQSTHNGEFYTIAGRAGSRPAILHHGYLSR